MNQNCSNNNQLDTLRKMEPGTKFKAKTFGGEERRCMLENDNDVFVYAPKHRTRGWRYSIEAFCRSYTMLPDTSATDWHKRLNRACRCLRASGLWPNVLPVFEKLLHIEYEDWQQMRKIDNSLRYCLGIRGWEKRPGEEMDAIWAPFKEKYPFAFTENNGHTEIDPGIVSEESVCKLRSMYFGTRNAEIKAELKKAIVEHSPAQFRAETSYDVTATYDPKLRKAWYSEEYKGTGNGHYYLMLDHNLALFSEDD